MVWAIFGLAVATLGLVTTFALLYVGAIKREYKAKSEAKSYELALASSKDVLNGLREENTRRLAQIKVLRDRLVEVEDALADPSDAADLAARLDKLLSEPMPKDDQGSGEGERAVSASPGPDSAPGEG